MSHFYTVALIEPTEAMNIENAVAPLLAPYDENMEVGDYETDCYCVGNEANCDARDKATEAIIAETGKSLDDLRSEHRAMTAGQDLSWEESSESWQKFTKTWFDRKEELEQQFLNEHPMKGEPSSSCEECEGSGRVISSYNPQSKWDWYQVGGRWSGQFDIDYDPATDPDNIETCFLCRGTGMRNDKIGQQARANDPTYTCNGCSGKGKSVKWPTEWKNDRGNVELVSNLLKLDDDKFGEIAVPYALVTVDGWAERGQMGWFGMSSNKVDKDDWNAQVRAIFENNPDKLAVVVDCHI